MHPSELEHGHVMVRYFFAGSGRQRPIELSLGEQRVTVKGRYFIGVNDTNALLAAALAGLGIMHAPSFMAQPHIDAGLLVPVLKEWSAELNPISIVYSPNRHLSTRVRVFVDWMVELFNAQRLVLA
ncbi:LysR substrate-binding domain-containing protein [Undibacterium arcticum]|uniref:LysR substrate-binding domain-containing protein n=2 Tax=Undibacterium arcticum TaxID=1762892 RepID=A0ABV7F3G7_9BURK